VRRIILTTLILLLLINLTNADYGYSEFSPSCVKNGTGAGGKNGFTLGNIGYGGCWHNDPSSGIVFVPCNPENTYRFAKTWQDSSVLFAPIFQNTNVINNQSWSCYDWIAVDTNVIVDIWGNMHIGRECNPNNIGSFKNGQLTYNIDCGFAGNWDHSHCFNEDLGQTLDCAPIDCEPLMTSSTLYNEGSVNSNTTYKYYCRDFLIYLKQIMKSKKPDNKQGVWQDLVKNYYYTEVLPDIHSVAFNQKTGKIVEIPDYYPVGPLYNILPFSKALPLMTPTNIDFELSAMCLSNNIDYDTFVSASNIGGNTPKTVMIGDWYPLHVLMPPLSAAWNSSSVIDRSLSGLSLWWEKTTATTSEQNICNNKANIHNIIQETPSKFIKNPAAALQDLMPEWIQNGINLLAFIIDLAICIIIAWLLFNVIKAWLDLREFLYKRKIFLCIIPGIRYVGWAVGSLIAYSIILQNELAFKIAAIFAGIHWLFGINFGSNIIETAIVGAASVILGFLPTYFYQVIIILATLMIGITILVLLYDAYLIYLKRLAYPRLK